ncbi:hypothetical protein F5Y18DRAFT_435387 [Xylariaceae sp. FL1019]|nr:hypothetical protein F5Y18DRAFT_435387 [Xylariaceae sp. FL1019]
MAYNSQKTSSSRSAANSSLQSCLGVSKQPACIGTREQPSQSFFKSLFRGDGHATKPKPALRDQLVISAPLPVVGLTPPHTTGHAVYPGGNAAALSKHSTPIFPPPSSKVQAVKINRANLASSPREGLNSHPTAEWLDDLSRESAKKVKAPERPLSERERAIKARNRKVKVYQPLEDGPIGFRNVEDLPARDVIAERRAGRVFATSTENDRVPPVVNLYPPPEGDVQQVDTQGLTVDHAYQRLYKDSSRDVRRLNGRIKELERFKPLAWLVAEAQDIHPGDIEGLTNALRNIILDRERLAELLPLAETLATNTGLSTFDRLQPALLKILEERDRAKSALFHQKQRNREAKLRIKDLESELRDDRARAMHGHYEERWPVSSLA